MVLPNGLKEKKESLEDNIHHHDDGVPPDTCECMLVEHQPNHKSLKKCQIYLSEWEDFLSFLYVVPCVPHNCFFPNIFIISSELDQFSTIGFVQE